MVRPGSPSEVRGHGFDPLGMVAGAGDRTHREQHGDPQVGCGHLKGDIGSTGGVPVEGRLEVGHLAGGLVESALVGGRGVPQRDADGEVGAGDLDGSFGVPAGRALADVEEVGQGCRRPLDSGGIAALRSLVDRSLSRDQR